MKNFFKASFFILILLLSTSLVGAEDIVEADENISEQIDVGLVLRKYVDDIEYLDKKYPKDLIDEDFSDDIAKFYPEMDSKNLFEQSQFLRWAVKVYRSGNIIYDKYKEMMLTPPTPTLIVADDEYDMGEVPVYQDVGKPLIINDFKKVISYGSEPQDIAAYNAKRIIDRGNPEEIKHFKELEDVFSKLDFKKILLYGIVYDSPFKDNRGIGEWAKTDKVKSRLLSNTKETGDKKELKMAVQIAIPRGYLILTDDFLQYEAMQIKISASENLQNYTLNPPVPQRINFSNGNNVVGYANEVIIPLQLNLINSKLPLKLEAEINLTLCGKNVCEAISIKPELELKAGVASESRVASFLRNMENILPKENNPQIKITNLIAEPSSLADNGQILRINLLSKNNPSDFDIFIHSDDNIKFARPLIRIDGKKIVARFRALDNKIDLNGKEFTITARLDRNNSVRQKMSATDKSVLDAETNKLNLGIIMLGILGGFLLNLMPCVFPVLSLKLLAFTKFGGMNEERIRSSFLYNILGIFAAFVILIVMLISLKQLGMAIGWGMQFQNIYFLIFICFVVMAFLAQVFGLLNISTSTLATKFICKTAYQEKLSHFMTGLFLVLLATPCTAPYLGTALGFALSGSTVDIVVIMLAIALGLASPYILLALSPSLATLVPHPGPWMQKVNRLMIFMLFLTIIWLLSIVYVQTSAWTVVRLAIYLGLFLSLLAIRKYMIEMTDNYDENPEVIYRVKRLFNLITTSLIFILLIVGFWDAKSSYNDKRSVIAASHYSQMIKNEVIKQNLNNGKMVLLRIGADWCLSCKYNDFTVFSSPMTKDMMEDSGVEVIDIDWTNYNPQVLNFMEKFGRKGLPFYVLYSQRIPDGMVLPEIIAEKEFRELVENLKY